MNPLITAPVIGFAIALGLGPILLPILRRLKVGQVVRSDGPQRHLAKTGTPTMGGVLFLLGGTAAALIVGPRTPQLSLVLLALVGYGAVGFVDDYLKVVLKRPLGLRAREKLLFQVILGLVIGAIAVYYLKLPTTVRVPFTSLSLEFGWWYIPFAAFIIVGFANAVNFADGVDGLCGTVTVIALVAYGLIGLQSTRPELAIAATGLAGAIGGFLYYNYHPAKLFMGDTGSLGLGGALGTLAVLTKTELTLVIVGGIYVVETISVILQVLFFKTTGRRIFRMAPIHHHFELCGWSEEKIVLRFGIVAAICALLGLWGSGGGGIIG
jgi:phospho-N-acetylmuramoyl-pentapeptide-transferase